MEILTPETNDVPQGFRVGQEVEVKLRGHITVAGPIGITVDSIDPNYPYMRFSFPANMKGTEIVKVYPEVHAGEVWRTNGFDFFVQIIGNEFFFIPARKDIHSMFNIEKFFDTFATARKVYDPVPEKEVKCTGTVDCEKHPHSFSHSAEGASHLENKGEY